jgi:hypothetical protein
MIKVIKTDCLNLISIPVKYRWTTFKNRFQEGLGVQKNEAEINLVIGQRTPLTLSAMVDVIFDLTYF